MLDEVVIAAIVAAAACFVYAFKTVRPELEAKSAMEKAAAAAIAEHAQRAADEDPAAARVALMDGTSLVKALAELANALGKLRQSVAALLLAFGLLVFAGAAASVNDKVADPPAATQSK